MSSEDIEKMEPFAIPIYDTAFHTPFMKLSESCFNIDTLAKFTEDINISGEDIEMEPGFTVEMEPGFTDETMSLVKIIMSICRLLAKRLNVEAPGAQVIFGTATQEDTEGTWLETFVVDSNDSGE